MDKILIVISTYNERQNIPMLVDRISVLGKDISILIVDDGSPDGTGEVADEIAINSQGRIRVIHRSGLRGRGLAGMVGLSEAINGDFDYIVEMDADLSHDPAQLPALLEAITGADIVIGSRYINTNGFNKASLPRLLISNLARFLSYYVLGLHYTDPTSGYRVYRKDILRKLPFEKMISKGFSIEEEILYYAQRANARIDEVGITYYKRQNGQSKINIGIIINFVITLIRIRVRNII